MSSDQLRAYLETKRGILPDSELQYVWNLHRDFEKLRCDFEKANAERKELLYNKAIWHDYCKTLQDQLAERNADLDERKRARDELTFTQVKLADLGREMLALQSAKKKQDEELAMCRSDVARLEAILNEEVAEPAAAMTVLRDPELLRLILTQAHTLPRASLHKLLVTLYNAPYFRDFPSYTQIENEKQDAAWVRRMYLMYHPDKQVANPAYKETHPDVIDEWKPIVAAVNKMLDDWVARKVGNKRKAP